MRVEWSQISHRTEYLLYDDYVKSTPELLQLTYYINLLSLNIIIGKNIV